MKSPLLQWAWYVLGLTASISAILLFQAREDRAVAAPHENRALAAITRCGTPEVTDQKTLEALRQKLAGARIAATTAEPAKITIPVQFIHITHGSLGQITEQQRQDQIDVLNEVFEEWGIQFSYSRPPKFADNAQWFNMPSDSQIELAAKTALQEDPQTTLNFYTCNPAGGSLLGWATFPWDVALNPQRDGVVIHWQSLPGGELPDYNLGHTATHEIGHWLGLFHTFQGGCDGIGDQVHDTIAHASENFGCPSPGGNGACNADEEAPIHNFMNYTDDDCMTEFTPGQAARMQFLAGLFRPNVGICDCVLDCLSQRWPGFDGFPAGWLPQLRALRDNLLGKSADGRRLVRLYYQHSPELFRIMATDRELRRRSVEAILAALPQVPSDKVVLPSQLYDECLILLERLETRSSPDLTAALQDVRAILDRRAEVAEGVVVLRFPPDHH